MHRTLKQEVAMSTAKDRCAQQRALDHFHREYNQVRPHEALGMQTPANVYAPSCREYPRHIAEPEYPQTMLVCSVHSKGHFRWKKRHDMFDGSVVGRAHWPVVHR
jgi:integrase-like protein